MVLYILHSNKISTFNLPNKISGSYVISDEVDNKKEDLIKVESVNGEWVAYSNDIAQIYYNNNSVASIPLVEYQFYQLKLYDSLVLTVYVSPGYEKNYSLRTISDSCTILIGSDSSNDIVFQGVDIKQLELSFKNNTWYFKNLSSKIPVYVNLKRKDEGNLKNFDILFLMGLKIIFLNENILINNPTSRVNSFSNIFTKKNFEYIIQNYDNKGRTYKDFYEPDKYFSKSPLFKKSLKKRKILIVEPPSIEKDRNMSVLMEVIPSTLMSVISLVSTYYTIQRYKSGESDRESFVTSILMSILLLITGVLWPFIQRGYEKLRNFFFQKRTTHLYKKYLKNKKKEIEKYRLEDQATLKMLYIDAKEIAVAIKNKNSNLYSVDMDNPDFLKVRLGVGTIRFNVEYEYSKPEFEIYPNKLYKNIDNMLEEERMLENVPVAISLKDNITTAFINKNVSKYNLIRTLFFQIATLHSFLELKIVVLTDDYGISELSFIKKLNHCWDNSLEQRFFATNINEGQDLSSYLEKIFANRRKESSSGKVEQQNREYYLILCDNVPLYRDLNIVKDICNCKENLGFSITFFDEKTYNIPNKVVHFVEYDSNSGHCFDTMMDENTNIIFKPELCLGDDYLDIDKYSTLLANIPIKNTIESSSSLPTQLGFLEMYGVGKVELLNSDKRWKDSDVVNTLTCPIGVDVNNNIINLDLHEKRHGPHGLVAGMTGSGKSEFIVTYILSMAVNYSPDEVQFVLIDYKGGGLAGAFENRKTGVKLPHLVGTITNLDKSEMYRTLASIQSELQRRQRRFNEEKERLNTGSLDIYKYQKLHREGKISEPMSHLFIISDEFAELKSQQPEFMDQLVSAARIGRSLGIHLILATQKPSGVVDDQIWSNSKFKVCCKVQTSEDSNDMLGKPDAAFLKDSGRFYLQVGYDVYYILGQSAYSGGKYIPSDKILSKLDNTIRCINNVGEPIITIDTENKVVTSDLGEELGNILNYIIKVAKDGGYTNSQLWLDNIPNHIYLDDIKIKYKNIIKNEKGIINPPVGEYDDPSNQSQGLVTLPITLGGNCFIAGVSGSGKTTFISTLVLSTIISHSVDDVNFYIIDFANETLKKFKDAPQVVDVLTVEDSDKINILLKRIVIEISSRKEFLLKYNTDFLTYIKQPTGKPMPNIIIIINGFDAFKDQFEQFMEEEFLSIIRECNKYGITFIISSTDPGVLFSTQLEQFPQHIAFKFIDNSLYYDFCETNIVPSDNPGRGIIKINNQSYQFQTALILPNDKLKQGLELLIQKLNTMITTKIEPISLMPDVVSYTDFMNHKFDLASVPIGYNIETIYPSYYDFTKKINFITSSKKKNLVSFVESLTELFSRIGSLKVIILDGNDSFKSLDSESVKYYNSNFAKLLPFLVSNIAKQKSSDKKIFMFIFGYSNIESHLSDYYNENNVDDGTMLEDLICKSLDSNLYNFAICGKYENSNSIENEKWYKSASKKDGILLYSNFDEQDLIFAKRSRNEYDLNLDDTNAIVVRKSNKEFITYISNL